MCDAIHCCLIHCLLEHIVNVVITITLLLFYQASLEESISHLDMFM